MNSKRGGLMLAGVVLMLAVANGAWAASEKVLYAFHGTDGWLPTSVIVGADGALYGTTMNGGTSCGQSDDCGVVFQLTRGSDGKWSETVLHDFGGGDGWLLNGALVADRAGNLYGTTVYGGPNGCSPWAAAWPLNWNGEAVAPGLTRYSICFSRKLATDCSLGPG